MRLHRAVVCVRDDGALARHPRDRRDEPVVRVDEIIEVIGHAAAPEDGEETVGATGRECLAELAGHADLTTTMRYMHLAKGSKEAVIAVLDQPAPRSGDLLETQTPG